MLGVGFYKKTSDYFLLFFHILTMEITRYGTISSIQKKSIDICNPVEATQFLLSSNRASIIGKIPLLAHFTL